MVGNKIITNLDAITAMTGALKGMGKAMDDDYIDSVIRQAHGYATKQFDLAAAATASTGKLSHMYEFGTAGITRGTVRYPDPTAPSARLYNHQLLLNNGHGMAFFTFRPAVNRNPRPTTKDTGVASKYLRKISRRKYVFTNKAFVTESGQTVELKAKNSDFIFVPFGQEPSRDPKNKKGFVMFNTTKFGPIKTQPGKNSNGTFTQFWAGWWNTSGQKTMDRRSSLKVSGDLQRAIRKATLLSAKQKMKPANPESSIKASKVAEKESKVAFGKGGLDEI